MNRDKNEWDVLRWKDSEIQVITPFDISSIWDLSDEEIIFIVEKSLKVSLDDPAIYNKINKIYKKVLSYMIESLFYTTKELWKLTSLHFSKKEDILKFLKDTSRHKWVLNCAIAKLFQAFNDADEEFNERVRFVKEKTNQVIDRKLLLPLQIKKNDEDTFVWETFIEVENWIYRKISFTIKKRIKSTYSSVSKEVRDPKYFTADTISDWFWATVEVEKKEDILPLMQMIAGYVFKKWDYEIKNDKWMFSEDEIISTTEISDSFKDMILKGTISRNKPESWDVCDIKLVTPTHKKEDIHNLSLEIKFVIQESHNETGLNMHWVYNYMKKVNERIRLQWYISTKYIEIVAKKFLENLSDILYKNTWRKEKEGDSIEDYKAELFTDLKEKWFILSSIELNNSHVKANIDDYIILWLIWYFKSKLIPVKRRDMKEHFYTNKRWLKVSQWDENWVGAVSQELIDLRD
jgi:hypothetical protein